MATHKLAAPIRVGDLKNGITVDNLELVSVAINWQPENKSASVSCMLRHPNSGWIHTVTLAAHTQKSAEADALWAAVKKAFPNFETTLLGLLAEHLPAGSTA